MISSGVRRGRRWGSIAAIPVMVLGLTVLSAPPAAASLGVLTVDVDWHANGGGDTTESETAECGGGSTLIGAGWSARGNKVIVDEVVPDVATGTVRAEAWEEEDGSIYSYWTVEARAICATGVYNVGVVNDGSSVYDSNWPKSDTARCPFGKKVVGLGFEIGLYPPGQVHVTSIVPSADRVTVTAYEDDTGTTDSWAVTA